MRILDEIPVNWKKSKIKFIAQFSPEITHDVDYNEDIGYAPMNSIKNGYMEPLSANFSSLKSGLTPFQDGDVVLAKVTPCFENGNIAIAEGLSQHIGYGSSELFVLRNKNIDRRFLFYFLQNENFKHSCEATMIGTGGLKRINPYFFQNAKIIYPSQEKQKEIVLFLDDKCDKIKEIIARIQSQISTLEEYKKSVITKAVTKGLNPDVQMKDSGVRWCPKIPSHWNVYNPKALFTMRDQRAKTGERQLTASQKHGIVYQDEFMEMESQRVVVVVKDFSILKHVEPGDFVISMRSFQGGLEYSTKRGCISSAYVMLIPNKEKVYPPFYRWFFKSSKYINALQSTTNLIRDGQAMRYKNFAMISLFDIPLEEQKEIADYLDEKCKKIDHLIVLKKEQFLSLDSYKKSLIFAYVTGKKEVPSHE